MQVVKKRRFKGVARVAAMAMIAGSVLLIPATSHSAGVTVRATGNDVFSPATKTVAKGTKVTWKATGDDHTVTAYGGWNKNTMINEGQQTSKTFKNKGTYKYRCEFHSELSGGQCSGMCGKIKVTG
jgi:plastocyanin